MNLVVPKAVGVRLAGGTEGLGQIKAPGFTKTDGGLTNAEWRGSGPKIDLTLTRGVGEITVSTAE